MHVSRNRVAGSRSVFGGTRIPVATVLDYLERVRPRPPK
jgi:uncharacterized protein (DUF433 family)